MKNYKRTVIITTLLLLVPIIIGLLLWNQLPERIATHFGLNNQPDGWSSRAMAVFGLPGIILGCHLLCAFGMQADPKKKNVSGKITGLVLWVSPILAMATCGSTYAIALGKNVDIGMVCMLLIGVVFIVMGNYLPKCRQNFTVGIKIPWTLNSTENWNRTHRMAGILWMLSGVILVVNAFIGFSWLIPTVLVVAGIAPMVYSFLLYKKGI